MAISYTSKREVPPPDYVGPFRKNVWLFGLRTPFLLTFTFLFGMVLYITPQFYLTRFILLVLAGFLGLGVAAHYIDILKDSEYFESIFGRFNKRLFKTVTLISLLGSIFVGFVLAYLSNWWFLAFVAAEVIAVLGYNLEVGNMHNHVVFGISWGFIPALAHYYAYNTTVGIVPLLFCICNGFIAATILELYQHSKTECGQKSAAMSLNLLMVGLLIGLAGGLIRVAMI